MSDYVMGLRPQVKIIKLYESAKELLEDSPTALNVRLVT